MRFVRVKIRSLSYMLELVQGLYEMNIGMSKYRSPPSYGMLFPLMNRYKSVTMRGVSFPLDISFYDKDWNPLRILNVEKQIVYQIRMYPSDPDISIPQGSYYMIELPVYTTTLY